ncbi:MAG: diacylglycerol kinase family lipid kinase [Myxococcales bacterium]|nr:diacylglycerol kinase family lipid kinase [Myxococcales bacterium]
MTEAFYTILNGAAGGGRCRARADRALYALRMAGVELAGVHLTEGPGHATDLAADAFADGHRRFLSVGGDGTAFEVINGLFPAALDAGETPTLGLLPLGTGNSFLRDFGVGTEAAARDALARGRTRKVDVLALVHAEGTLYYINTLGTGFVAEAGRLTNERFKSLGAAGYIAAVLTALARLDQPEVALRFDDDAAIDRAPATFVTVANSRYTGGAMMLAPDADPCDGVLDVVHVGPMRRGALAAALRLVFSGAHVDLPEVRQRRARRVEWVDGAEQPLLIDGELKVVTPLHATVLPGAIEVVA